MFGLHEILTLNYLKLKKAKNLKNESKPWRPWLFKTIEGSLREVFMHFAVGILRLMLPFFVYP